MDNSGNFFRPIRDEPIIRSSFVPPLPPITPLSPFSSNVTGRGGTSRDYRRSTREYVDNNANAVNFGKPMGDDRLIQLENDNEAGSSAGTEAATNESQINVPALLLDNQCNDAPLISKLPNGDVNKTVRKKFFFFYYQT